MSISYKKISDKERNGQYEGIVIEKDGMNILELRITFAALLNDSCKLNKSDFHQWLYEIGNTVLDEIKEFKVMEITAADVVNKEIVGSWKERELYK